MPTNRWLGFASLLLVACGNAGSNDHNGASAAGMAGASSAGHSGSGGATTSGGGARSAAGGSGGETTSTGGSGGAIAGGGSKGQAGGSSGGGPVAYTNTCSGKVKTDGGHPVLTPGVWKKIGTPNVENSLYGAIGITIDPCDPSTLYTVVQDDGIYKTTDGGSSWVLLGSPSHDTNQWDKSTDYLGHAFEVAVDPADSTHLYATDGVRGGGDEGFWISTDGGNDWTQPQGFVNISKTTTVDTTDMAIDPADFRHILLSSHSQWSGLSNAGILESKDGGENWVAHPPRPEWSVGTPGIEFLYDPATHTGDGNTWLLMGSGFWRTTDAGGSWTKVSDRGGVHGLTVAYRAASGAVYAGGFGAPARSTDNGVTWQAIQGLPYASYYVVNGDGKKLFTMKSLNFGSQPYPHYSTSNDDDGVTWTDYDPSQTFSDGPITMKFDSVNRILYSANWKAGLLALKVAD